MKQISKFIFIAILPLSVIGCMKQFDPQDNRASQEQVNNSPGAFDALVKGVTNDIFGRAMYTGNPERRADDFGLPALFLKRDVMGQDIIFPALNWWGSTYNAQGMSPSTATAQFPWTIYYKWIKNCNIVIGQGKEKLTKDRESGIGIAHAMRAFFYMDLARLYAPRPYGIDKNAKTVPIVTEVTTSSDLTNNKRATNETMWKFIMEDLELAEKFLKDYKRTNKMTPDLSVVYGLKARAYLEMHDWVNAEKYAKMAQMGYSIMDKASYTSWEKGFNTPNDSWMLACTQKPDDKTILLNDADTSWGSHMILEIVPETGYASAYGQNPVIDRHLYETIPTTDFRRECYVDFAIDDLAGASKEETKKLKIDALRKYSNYPNELYRTGENSSTQTLGGLPLKFRAIGGDAGHQNQYIGFVVALPLMRVEEMFLIEAEAAGMQNEARGKILLEAFARTRDPHFVYGKHNEAYGNMSNTAFQNEIWWQRRIEFWGEGFATFDIKRFGKGIIRNYKNSNHVEQCRWNLNETPSWMTPPIVQTETNYNDIENNPTPTPPNGDSPIHIF